MFAGLARRYDLANHLLSGGVDFLWRRRLVKLARALAPGEVYDLATGSGDVAFALREALPAESSVTGMDFCEPMLEQARQKRSRKQWQGPLQFTQGDCLALPLQDGVADLVSIAFGVRNFENRLAGLQEMRRILKPGGHLLVLEFSQPFAWFRPLYYAYLKHVLPTLAAWVTGDKKAYDYLAGSIESFPDRPQMAAMIREAGFSEVKAYALTLGIVALHHATN